MVRVAPLLRPWSAGLRQPQTRSPRGSPHERRAGLTDVGVLEPRSSLWHCCARNCQKRRGLAVSDGVTFIRHVEEESSQNSAHPCLQLPRTPCRAAEPTNRYASLAPLHRITASRRRGQSASPALSIKVSRFRSEVTCQFVTLHRATTTRRLEATTPEKGAPTNTRTAMARRTTRTTTARRTTRAAAGLAPTPRPPAT